MRETVVVPASQEQDDLRNRNPTNVHKLLYEKTADVITNVRVPAQVIQFDLLKSAVVVKSAHDMRYKTASEKQTEGEKKMRD
jgi:hypothetical protein